MRKIYDFKKHADECRAMAGRASTEEHRQMLLRMVETWESLARDRTQRMARQARTAGRNAGEAESETP